MKLIIFIQFEISNPVVGCCQGTLRSYNTCHMRLFECDCSNTFSFRDVMFFFFFQSFSKNLSTKKFTKFDTTNLMKTQTYCQRIRVLSGILSDCKSGLQFLQRPIKFSR